MLRGYIQQWTFHFASVLHFDPERPPDILAVLPFACQRIIRAWRGYFQVVSFVDGVLSVNTATKEDRDLPIKATDVDVIVGNIEVLLETI